MAQHNSYISNYYVNNNMDKKFNFTRQLPKTKIPPKNNYNQQQFQKQQPKMKKRQLKWHKKILNFINPYFNDSAIHGFAYLAKRNLTFIEKCLWLFLIIISICFCVVISIQSINRYYTKSTVIGLERNYQYWNTTLPSVTVCPMKRLDDTLFTNYCRAHNLNESEQNIFFVLMESLANATYINLKSIPVNDNLDRILQRLKIKPPNYIELIYNLTLDTSQLKNETPDVDDVVNDHIRSVSGTVLLESRQVLTEYGLCYTTNTLISKKYSSRYFIFGVYPNITEVNEHIAKITYFDTDISYNFVGFSGLGIDFFLHSPYEVMKVDANMGYTSLGARVSMESKEIISENGFEAAQIFQRRCRFPNESNLTHFPVYTRNFCHQNCRLEMVNNVCGCIPHFYPNKIAKPKRICSYKKLRDCVSKYTTNFLKLKTIQHLHQNHSHDVKCYCLPNCQDAIINTKEVLITDNKGLISSENSIIVQMLKTESLRLKRQIIFSFSDLLVSIGATAGLFLGFSVLGAVEVIYYFTIRLFCYKFGYKG